MPNELGFVRTLNAALSRHELQKAPISHAPHVFLIRCGRHAIFACFASVSQNSYFIVLAFEITSFGSGTVFGRRFFAENGNFFVSFGSCLQTSIRSCFVSGNFAFLNALQNVAFWFFTGTGENSFFFFSFLNYWRSFSIPNIKQYICF